MRPHATEPGTTTLSIKVHFVTAFQKYLRIYERYAAMTFLVIALLLPRVSAVLIEFIPGVETVVICTGDAYVTVTLGPDGEPIDSEESSDSRCTLSDSIVVADAHKAFWHHLALSHHHPFVIHENHAVSRDALQRLEPSRAPPALI